MMKKRCNFVTQFERRKRRVRAKVRDCGRLRLSVYRSNRYFYAQLIDDEVGYTVVSASSLEDKMKEVYCGRLNITVVKEVAKLMSGRIASISDAVLKDKIDSGVVFDRGAYRYMGLVAGFADSLRELGVRI